MFKWFKCPSCKDEQEYVMRKTQCERCGYLNYHIHDDSDGELPSKEELLELRQKELGVR